MGRAIVNKESVAQYAKEVFDLFNQGFITSEMATKLIKSYIEENTTYEDQPVAIPYKAPKPGIGLHHQIDVENPYQYKIVQEHPCKSCRYFRNFLNWDFIAK